jgi:hypothetical protein
MHFLLLTPEFLLEKELCLIRKLSEKLQLTEIKASRADGLAGTTETD